MDQYNKYLLPAFASSIFSMNTLYPFGILFLFSFNPCCFCRVSPIPSSKVGMWFGSKLIRISLFLIHKTSSSMSTWPHQRPWDCAGMTDSNYILMAEENVFTNDIKRDQEMERVKWGLGDHIWPSLQPCKVKFQTFKYL